MTYRLFRVEDAQYEKGKSGYHVWRFLLTPTDGAISPADTMDDDDEDQGNGLTGTKTETVTRVIRDTKKRQAIKKLYDYTCQVCRRSTTQFPATAIHTAPSTVEAFPTFRTTGT